MRRAVGDAAGLTIKAQVRQAARHLGYPAEDWLPRELWYGRCASVAALIDLRERVAAWREREAARAAPGALAQRVAAVRRLLTELERQVAGLEAEITLLTPDGTRPHGGSTADV